VPVENEENIFAAHLFVKRCALNPKNGVMAGFWSVMSFNAVKERSFLV
jgi:hypothetical protein